MKQIITKFQKIMAAAAFAEAGEWDTARELTPETELSREPILLNKIFMAVTFAESGLHDEAVRLLGPVGFERSDLNGALAASLGLKGVRLMYGTVSI
jgi:hypothetical protein